MKLETMSRIRVTVEVRGSAYGEDWTVGAIQKQAASEAVQMLRNTLSHKLLAIVGEPKVLVVIASEDKAGA